MSGDGGGTRGGPSAAAMEALLARVREASRSGDLVPIAEAWNGPREELDRLLAGAAFTDPQAAGTTVPDAGDLRLVARGDRAFLYSDRHMTRRYAELVARVSAGNLLATIAETVRDESATYPRPTPLDVFLAPPFRMSADALEEAMARLACDARYADIRLRRASDGTAWLYSADHLSDSHAASLIEWMAVGRLENP